VVLEGREALRVLDPVPVAVFLLQEVVDLGRSEIVGVAAVDLDQHGVAGLHVARPFAEELRGEDLLAHRHRPLLGAVGRDLHLAGLESPGEGKEAAVADGEAGDRVVAPAELL
jgi:hypothetical protein